MTTALPIGNSAERTPPPAPGLHGRIRAQYSVDPGDFGDFLKKSSKERRKTPDNAVAKSATPNETDGEADPTAPPSASATDSAVLAAFLLGLQLPPTPPTAEPTIPGGGSAEDSETGTGAGTGTCSGGSLNGEATEGTAAGPWLDANGRGASPSGNRESGKSALSDSAAAKANNPVKDGDAAQANAKQEAVATTLAGATPSTDPAKQPGALNLPNTFTPLASAETLQEANPNPTAEQTTPPVDNPKNDAVSVHSFTAQKGPMTSQDNQSEKPVSASGTPAASTGNTMQFARFQDGFAGGGKQELPGRNSEGSAKEATAAGSSADAVAGMTQPTFRIDELAAAAPAAPAKETAQEAANLRMERISELLHTEAMIMRQVKPASLTAVLRPDAQTELHLQLRFDRNGIEATCHCEKGDMASLAAGWSDLQQQLGQQGVRLMPIQAAAASSNTSNGWFQGSGGHDSPNREAREELPVFWGSPNGAGSASKSSRPAVRPTPSTEGGLSRYMLESWA
ncbi:MAG TPA: hypothetical protein VMF06_10255 [Candidatus Limnocylindria bacterium]|nr:hypothetical protein [Candidatus Limnocylindria bacterium]